MSDDESANDPTYFSLLRGHAEGERESDGSINLVIKLAPGGPAGTGGGATPAATNVPPAETELEKRRKRWKEAIIIMILASIIWMACCILAPPFLPFVIPVQWIWIITLAVFIADGMAIGYYITGRRSGIFINERKLVSISRVQVALWTLLILSAFFAIFVVRLRSGAEDPINIGIDLQLWALMGISLGSLAGRTVIMGKKAGATPEPAALKRAVQEAAKNLPGEEEDDIKANATGVLYTNKEIDDASLMDIFQGDEVGNTWLIDIGKIQMFFFTVVTIITYAAAIWGMLLTTAIGSMTALPPLSDGFVAILGISHAGLLATSGTTNMPVQS